MFIILLLLYPIAIQYQRGGLWLIVSPITVIAGLVDVYCNYTELALLTWDFPKAKEYTFSERCNRLITQTNWAGKVGRATQAYCNFFMAGHIE